MRALIMADCHIGKLIRGRSRLFEHEKIVANFLAAAERYNVDVCILPGDLFDNPRPGPDEIRLFARIIARCQDFTRPLIVTPGNHDGPTTLRDAFGKVTAWVSELGLDRVHAVSDPGVTTLKIKGQPHNFFSLPYPHKRSFDNLVDRSLLERTEEVSKALENIISAAWDGETYRFPPGPLFFIGHLSTLNAELSADQAMRMGWDVTVREEVFDGFAASFLGHIHRYQKVGARGAYSGSPFYTDFGEHTQSKGFLLYDDGGERDAGGYPVSDPFVQLDSGCLPMVSVDITESTGWEFTSEPPDKDFTGWLQIRLDPDQGGAPSWKLKRQLRERWPDAAGVWTPVLPRPPITRSRLDPAVRTTDPTDMVHAYAGIHDLSDKVEDPALQIMEKVDAL